MAFGEELLIAGAIFCSQIDMNAYQELVRSGMAHIDCASQMNEMFADVDNFVGSTVSREGTRTWNSEAFFYDRYILTMQIEVVVSPDGRRIDREGGEVTFFLSEVKEVLQSGTNVGIRYGESWKFGKREWDKVVTSGGDFSVIMIDLKKSQPVPNFDRYRMACGESRPKIVDK